MNLKWTCTLKLSPLTQTNRSVSSETPLTLIKFSFRLSLCLRNGCLVHFNPVLKYNRVGPGSSPVTLVWWVDWHIAWCILCMRVCVCRLAVYTSPTVLRVRCGCWCCSTRPGKGSSWGWSLMTRADLLTAFGRSSPTTNKCSSTAQ